MLQHKLTTEIFENRKQIKQRYGINQYRNMLKYNEIIYINNEVANDYELHCNHQRNSRI